MSSKMRFITGSLVTAALVTVGAFLVRSNQDDSISSASRADDNQPDGLLVRVGAAPESEGISRIHFADELLGWISDKNTVWCTDDGGKSWRIVFHSPSDRIWQVQFISRSKGWILVQGKLYGTTDAGNRWSSLSQPIMPYPDGDLANFQFVDDGQTGWIIGGVHRAALRSDKVGPPARYAKPGRKNVGLASAIFSTHDYGKNWRSESIPSRWGYLWNLFALDADHVWVTGIPGEFYLDKGKWREMDHGGDDEQGDASVKALNLAPGGPDEEPSCIFFLNRDHGWICNFNGGLAKSLDGGRTWETLFKFDDGSDVLSYFSKIYFANTNDGWALSQQGDLYQTGDGGSSWRRLDTGVKATSMFFVKRDYCLVLAKEGLFLLKT